jgi:hypothetical protein
MYNDRSYDGQPLNKKRLWAQEFYKYNLDGSALLPPPCKYKEILEPI